MKKIYDDLSFLISKRTTEKYSTSFSLGILALHPQIRGAIYAIYGFVRLADEIVDSFHGYNKEALLQQFKIDVHTAIKAGISLNPILHSFQATVHRYDIDMELIDHFLHSMEMDLRWMDHNIESYNEYIYGSAEVVGLMCLRVFVQVVFEKERMVLQIGYALIKAQVKNQTGRREGSAFPIFLGIIPKMRR